MLIVVDSNGLGYAAMYAVKGLSHGDSKTNVIFGFLNQVLTISKKLKSNDFVFCWDSKKSLRRLMWEPYKRGRNKKRQNMTFMEKEEYYEAMEQFTLLRKGILPALGFANVLLKTGFESDDIVASVVLQQWEKEQTIVTSDHDFYQLLGNGIRLYNHRTGKTITTKDFKKQYQIEPHMYSTVMTLAGCSTDGVPGIEGIGEKTAIKYLKGELKGNSKAAIKIRDHLENKEELMELYRKLVTLPFLDQRLVWKREADRFNEERFKKVFEQYDFKSFLEGKKWDDWREVFCVNN